MYYNNYGQPLFPAQQPSTAGPTRVTPLTTETYMSEQPVSPVVVKNTIAEYFQKNLWWIVAIVVIIIVGIFIWWKSKKPQEETSFLNF